jgi:hypothetical protein
MGFPLDSILPDQNPVDHLSTGAPWSGSAAGSTPLSVQLALNVGEHVSYTDPGEVEPLTEDIIDLLQEPVDDKPAQPKKPVVRVKYEDPWKIHAALVLSESTPGRGRPQVISWSGDGLRLQDKLPPRLFGEAMASQLKNNLHIWEVKDHAAVAFFLKHHTHWGNALWVAAADKASKYHAFSLNLKRRVLRLISGKSDPLMASSTRQKIFTEPDQIRPVKQRWIRLIELLKTIDGIFLQRYLVYPEEVWTWSKFDLFALQALSLLIGDEFLDGELTSFGLSITTSYTSLKKVRKAFKKASLRGDLKAYAKEFADSKHWARPFFGQLFERLSRMTGSRQVFCVGIVSQTRGAGRPPPLVTLQSKRDFISIVTEQPPELSPTKLALLGAALGKVLEDLPQEAFTGLATKARITVATSASWEKTRKEGGTAEAIRECLNGYSADDPVPIRDLNTGRVISQKAPHAFETVGEFVFWASLDTILRTPHEYLRYIFLTVVQEPGKARTVTKGSACLKIVLDVVNKICSWPLKKGIESSTSGMGRSHHAWNFFIRMMSDEMKEDLFRVRERQEEEFEGYVERTDTYEDFFVSSTDYKEATDAMLHQFASKSGNMWMVKCGIPPVLRGVVNMACYGPRTVVFTGTGGLSQFGVPSSLGEGLREIKLVRGVPMGDPLTKIVLHMTNIVTRYLGTGLLDEAFYRHFLNSNQAREAFWSGLLKDRQ